MFVCMVTAPVRRLVPDHVALAVIWPEIGLVAPATDIAPHMNTERTVKNLNRSMLLHSRRERSVQANQDTKGTGK
jgi:hypothetical protein